MTAADWLASFIDALLGAVALTIVCWRTGGSYVDTAPNAQGAQRSSKSTTRYAPQPTELGEATEMCSPVPSPAAEAA